MLSSSFSSDVRIDCLRSGITNCYLVRHQGAVLVDCGMPGAGPVLVRWMERLGVGPGGLRLIVLTHGHSDHAGAAAELAALTGAPIALHQDDARWLDRGRSVPVRGRTAAGRLLARALAAGPLRGLLSVPAFQPELRPGSADVPLGEFGVPGFLVHTPGHTLGSVSLVLEDGRALVGSAALGPLPPLSRAPRLPVIAEDEGLIASTWRGLLARGMVMAFPAHGAPFQAEGLRSVAGIA